MMANKLIYMASGCTLKAYRRDVIKDVLLYGEMHRFVPVYCSSRGGQARVKDKKSHITST
jgi:hypothetical protein